MKKQRNLTVIGLVLSMLMLIILTSGCGQKEHNIETDQEFQQEEVEKFIDYYQSIEPLEEKETAIIEGYSSVTGENFTNDEVLYNELVEEILPNAENLLDTLKDIQPADQKLQQLHEQFIEGWEAQVEGFKIMVEALDENDEQKMDRANRTLEGGSQKLEQFNRSLQQEAQERGVLNNQN
ncbi:MAG: hypothetical protein ACQES4_09885 [Bacillota bacterium]